MGGGFWQMSYIFPEEVDKSYSSQCTSGIAQCCIRAKSHSGFSWHAPTSSCNREQGIQCGANSGVLPCAKISNPQSIQRNPSPKPGSFPKWGNSNIIFIMGIPKKIPLILGNPHLKLGTPLFSRHQHPPLHGCLWR